MRGLAAGTAIDRPDVERAAAGDEAAFTRIVASHHGDMLRLAYMVTGDASLAQDAAQSAWTIAWRRLGSIRDATRIRPWLMSIAANEARQIARRRHRVVVTEIAPTVSGPSRSDPASGIDRLDLVRALMKLAPEDRAVLALRYVAGYDAAEVGTITGRSASATRTRLSRLTARLREDLRR